MNVGKITGANFVDLLKAFDTQSNSQIIANRSRCGITDMETELFTDYLFSGKQQVSYSGELSPLKSVTRGVPQGSSLDPLLLLISFDDTGGSLKFCDLLMYADGMVVCSWKFSQRN